MSIRILHGDCREVLRTLPDKSVHSVVTSPPYWGLRDYGTGSWEGGDTACDHIEVQAQAREGRETPGGRGGSFPNTERAFKAECRKCGAWRTDRQIGLEVSPDVYVAEMVAVFREVRRVLRDDGTLWLNLGDCYATGAGKVGDRPGGGERGDKWAGTAPRGHRGQHLPKQSGNAAPRIEAMGPMTQPNRLPIAGLKPKDLVGMPWRVAFALQADGWWLRKDNIWAKRNCMPESITDRTTTAHEYVFHFTKSGSSTFWTHRDKPGTRSAPAPDYRWVHAETKAELLVAPEGWPEIGKKVWRRINLWSGHDYFYDAVAIEEEGDIPAGTRAAKAAAARSDLKHVNGRPPEYYEYTGKRNKRSVWHVATQPFAEAHFATMPPAIAETCVLAGTSERGCCAACGAPWMRQIEKSVSLESGSGKSGRKPVGKGAGGEQTESGTYDIRMGPVVETKTTGWLPTCECGADVVPCTILDPFGGAGTTGMVADRLGRDAILVELNPEYIEITKRRLTKDAGMFADLK